MTSPFNAIHKAGPFYFCLLFIFYVSSFGQAIRPISVSDALIRTDDSNSKRASLGFRINFNGIRYDSVWVNNNGNLTFDSALAVFTPYLIQLNSRPMFAAFFADVDTRNYGDVTRFGTGTLQVAPGNTRNIFCINWINVGCYNLSNPAIVNSFQMIIIDRSDIVPGDFDLEYNYDKITWEAGTASEGNSSGLGGTKTASMGWSNGTNSFYSHTGSLTAGAFLDAGPRSLINNRLNSTVNGRYVFTVRNGVVIEDIMLSPGADTNIVGSSDTLIATVRDNLGSPIAGRKVFFRILSGPHSPKMDSSVTNASGIARFIYTGTSTGVDEIVAMMLRPALDTAFSNHAKHLWNPIPNLRPTTNPVTMTDTISATPAIKWTYRDPESDPQSQYEVEVWTGPNGSGTRMWDPPVGSGTLTTVTYDGTTLVSSQTYYARVRASDGLGWGGWSEVSWIAGSLPVAEAGANRVIAVQPTACTAVYTLDGTGSSGGVISYSWTGPFGTISGPGQIVTLPLGINKIYLTVTNTFGSSMDSVIVTVADSTAPIPDVDSLPEIHEQCSATLIPPKATDNCSTPITGTTTDPSSYTVKGTYTVRWTYTDNAGNKKTQLQTVVVRDTVAPIPSIATLPVIQGVCSVTLTAPSAIDNCAGTISGTTTDSLTYVTNGTRTVRWTYTDNNNNRTTQEQTVIVLDTVAPIPSIATLPVIQGVCSVTLSAPTATDNCAGTINGTTTDSLNYVTQGTRTVRWTYADRAGNTTTQEQTVIVRDTIRPSIVCGADTVVTISASNTKAFIALRSATASDNCMPGAILPTATRQDGLPLDSGYSVGVTEVKWDACDGNGNCANRVQRMTVRLNHQPQLTVISDTTILENMSLAIVITASDSDGNIPLISKASSLPPGCSVIDRGNGTALLSWNTGCNDHGNYVLPVKAFDGIDSTLDTVRVSVTDINFPPVFLSTSTVKQYAMIQKTFSYTVRTQDCDGTSPTLRAINLPSGASFTDNRDGTGSVVWTPLASEAGYYMVIFEAKDDVTAVRDTVIIVVEDEGHFTPAITVSSLDTTVGVNLPITLFVRATVQDGTVPILSAVSLPTDARITFDNEGSGVFSWTPRATGKDSLVLIARHVLDSTLQTRCTVKITVDNRNITGPHFLAHGDTAIDQKKELALTVEARDPDGTKPELFQVKAPQGVRFVDNGNGTGTFFWKPGCDVAGDFILRAGATDHYFSDTISVGVNVRVVNFPPVFAPIADKSCAAGEMVRIFVSAADNCIGSTTPTLSVSCQLPGYTFVTNDDGTGEFGWWAGSDTGSYPIIFHASNGVATADDTVMLSVNKAGTLVLSANPKGARIHVMPSGVYSGTLLGSDSVEYRAKPGVYWFEVEAPGFRAERVAFEIKADSVIRRSVTLKPAIPLMFSEPETVTVRMPDTTKLSGDFAFVDANGDGLLDLSVISHQRYKTYYRVSDASGGGFLPLPDDNANPPVSDAVSHVFCDWNDCGVYSCIMATSAGKILLLQPEKGVFAIAETLCTVTGSKAYPVVLDVDRDGKKDLVVHSENVGVFVFPNVGTDPLPKLGAVRELLDASGGRLTSFKGPPLLMDLDQAGSCKWIFSSDGVLKSFIADSLLSKLTYVSDLNCAGSRLRTDSSTYTIIGAPMGQPKLAVFSGGLLRVFSTRLCGDINGDGIVDIRDLSRVSKAWELIESDSAWVPQYNLNLSVNGPEVIDIRDISRISKFFELKE